MKKLLLCASAIIFALGSAQAQGWSPTGAHDDFATTTPYTNGPNGQGMIWFELTNATSLVLTRPNTGDGFMAITADNAGGGTYPVFGVNFNNDGGSPAVPYSVNLSSGANITMDIENSSATDFLFMSITLQDANGNKSDIEPDVSDVTDTSTYGYAGPPTNHYRRKALNGFTLAVGERKTITIDLSSIPAYMGGLTGVSYADCSKPATCPVTAYTIDATQITNVLFTVNLGSSDINLSEGDGDPTQDTFIKGTDISSYTGVVKMHDFVIGTPTTVLAITDAQTDASVKVYPNPAKEVLNVSFDATTGADITLTDMLGNKVYTTSAAAGNNQVAINTSGFNNGIYLLNITSENGRATRKVTIQ